jgi:hypothetical protein
MRVMSSIYLNITSIHNNHAIYFLYKPAVAAANSNFIKYLCPNTGR